MTPPEEWSEARKKPLEVEYRGPIDDPATAETLGGGLDIGADYLEEHGAFYLVRGTEGEVYPVAAPVFEDIYDTDAPSGAGWYYKGRPMRDVRVILIDAGSPSEYVVTGRVDGELVAYVHNAQLRAGDALEDYCGPADEYVEAGRRDS